MWSPIDGVLTATKRCFRGVSHFRRWQVVAGLTVVAVGKVIAALDGSYTVPLGRAATVRAGSDVTLVTYGAMVPLALQTAASAAAEGIDTEVIDVRTLLPLDVDHIMQSVEKTNRAIVLHEAPRTCGYGAELMAQIMERGFWHLEAPLARVTGFDTPFSYALEDAYMPSPDRILKTIRKTVEV